MPANLENSAVATGLEKVSFHSSAKEGQCQRLINLPHNCTHLTRLQSNAQILQARLQLYMKWELSDVQDGFRKAEREIKLSTSIGSSKEQQSSKKSTSALLTKPKPLTCGSQQTVESSQRDGNISPPYLPPEKSVCKSRRNRTRHITTDWFQTGKGVQQGHIL